MTIPCMNEPGCQASCNSDFSAALIRIAGLNPFGLPILRCVSGLTACKWIAGGWRLRYVKDTVDNWVFDEQSKLMVNYPEEVGLPYVYIERWRSPQFLAQTGRFRQRHDTDGSELLPELPTDGHYDYFLRLEYGDGSPHPPDDQALVLINAMWGYEHATTAAEREEHLMQSRLAGQAAAQAFRNDLWGYDPNDYELTTTSAGHQKYVRRQKEI